MARLGSSSQLLSQSSFRTSLRHLRSRATTRYTANMSTADQLSQVSVEQYLRDELASPVKHEYLGGVVYAMSGGTNRHSLVSTNVTTALSSRLRGKPCRAFNSDTKIRIRLPGHTRFYYPDASVICRPNSLDQVFQDHPALIVEVLSPSTSRADLSEKKDAYLSLPSLEIYLVIEPEKQSIIAFRRREEGFVREVWREGQILPLPELEIEIPVSDFFEGAGQSAEER